MEYCHKISVLIFNVNLNKNKVDNKILLCYDCSGTERIFGKGEKGWKISENGRGLQ